MARHWLAFLITLAIYHLPQHLINAEEHGYFTMSAMWSLVYIYLIAQFAKTRLSAILITVEMCALSSTIIAYLQWELSGGWFYDQHEVIIELCFLIEALITGTGVVLIGLFKRLSNAWISDSSHN